MSKVLSRILVTVYLSLLCQACITEVDVGACNNTVIRFEYLADGDEDVFPEYITSVTYCIYDSEGEIVTQATLDQNRLGEFQGVKLRLPSAGTYSLTAWGNLGGDCVLESQETLSGGRVVLPGENPKTFNKLYLGKLDFDLESVDGRHEWTAPMHSVHVTLNAYIQSTSDEFSASDFMLKVGEFATGVSNSGEILGPQRIYTLGFSEGENAMLEASAWLPRFNEHTSATIEVCSAATGNRITSVDLAGYISANNIRLTGVEEAVVDILISVSGTNISIRFPGWKPKPIYPSI